MDALNANFVISPRMNKGLTVAIHRTLTYIYMIFLIYSLKK